MGLGGCTYPYNKVKALFCYNCGAAWDFAVRRAEAAAKRGRQQSGGNRQGQGTPQERAQDADQTLPPRSESGGVAEVVASPMDDTEGNGQRAAGEEGTRPPAVANTDRPWKMDEVRAKEKKTAQQEKDKVRE